MRKRHRRRCEEDIACILLLVITTMMFIILFSSIYMLTHIIEAIEVNIDDTPAKQPIQPLEADTPSSEMPNIEYENTWLYRDEIMQEEVLYLQKITYAEAQGESLKGKILVAASVVNRVKHSDFPDTIKEVLEQTAQYANISWITEEYIANMVSWQKVAWEECRKAAERALEGEDPAEMFLGGPTLYFYNPDPSKCEADELEKREGIKTYSEGNHLFHHEGPKKED